MILTNKHILMFTGFAALMHGIFFLGFPASPPTTISESDFQPIRLSEFSEAGSPNLQDRDFQQRQMVSGKPKPNEGLVDEDADPDLRDQSGNENDTQAKIQESQKTQGHYEDLILALLESQKNYPKTAQKLGIEGSALLSLRIAKNGDLIAFKLNTSTGEPILDEAVHRMVKKASPFPNFPPKMGKEEVHLLVPIHFTLAKQLSSATQTNSVHQ